MIHTITQEMPIEGSLRMQLNKNTNKLSTFL